MHRDMDIEALAIELTGIAAMILGLSTQFADDGIDGLSNKYMDSALHSISFYLERISNDLSEMKFR